VCSLTLGTTWGSPTSPEGVIMSPETDDQLRPPALMVVATTTLVRPRWWSWQPAALPTRTLAVSTLTRWRQHHNGAEGGHRGC
jgi:hypothetical protein